VPANAPLADYYARRASEYERIYQKPERQEDLAALKSLCAETLAGRSVLEIACGTGYWTQAVSQTAKTIVATDINQETLEIARAKRFNCEVTFCRADAFQLKDLGLPRPIGFNAGMAFHWWSHLPMAEITGFLREFYKHFAAGAILVFVDNRYAEGSSTPISRTDAAGNTYQLRRLADGTEHEVLKNFPSEQQVRDVLPEAVSDVRWIEFPHYWFLSYRL
jgi:SAM-dependent methyltransferase